MVDVDIELGGPDIVPASPLYAIAGHTVDTPAFALSEVTHQHKVIVRGAAEDAQFSSGIQAVSRLALPAAPNTVARREDGLAELIWLGPDEWLYRTTEETQADQLVQAFRQSLQGSHAAVVDVSDYYVCLQISGSRIRHVLRKMTPLDLDTSLSSPERCAQSCFGHATVLVTQAGSDSLVLQVRWSYAEYIWQYLLEASQEYTSESA